jgi:hypothetical protein
MSPAQPFIVTMADFDTSQVVTDALNNSTNPIPFQYCATQQAAARLLTHLNTLGLHPTQSMDYPFPGWPTANVFTQSAQVPYFDFTNTQTGAIDHENVAGILSQYMEMGCKLTDYNCVNRWFAGDN